jgi:hypothetical protein
MATMTSMKPRPSRPYLSLQEAVVWYEIGYSTLRKLVAAGKLHGRKRPGDRRTYLAVEELEKVLTPRSLDEDKPEA